MAGQIANQSFSSFLDNNNNQKPQGPCQEQVHNITVHPLKLSNIHIDEHDPAREDKKAPFMKLNSLDKINKQSSEEYGLIGKYQEAREAAKESPCPIKTMEGSSKKHHNLSINIPTSSEHGGDSPAQVKTEKALPAKMRTAMNEDPNVVPTTKVGAKKSFAFSNYLFDQKLPTSPNRTFWVSQFLKQKLGDEKFEKVKELIDHSPNPTQLLKDETEKVMDIIGEDKRDCLVMLSFLVSHSTNSVTPTGENKVRTSRPSQMDGRNIKCFKSPASANPFLRNIFPTSNDPGSADRVNSQSKI